MRESAVGVRHVADETPQTSARLAALRFALNCHERKEATRLGSPDDGTKVKEDSANEHRST
jgi:hypothetical protein